jgi:hypothetical protein
LKFSKTVIVALVYLGEPDNFCENDSGKKEYFLVRYSGCTGLFSGTLFLPEGFRGLVDSPLKPALIKFRGENEFYLV